MPIICREQRGSPRVIPKVVEPKAVVEDPLDPKDPIKDSLEPLDPKVPVELPPEEPPILDYRGVVMVVWHDETMPDGTRIVSPLELNNCADADVESRFAARIEQIKNPLPVEEII